MYVYIMRYYLHKDSSLSLSLSHWICCDWKFGCGKFQHEGFTLSIDNKLGNFFLVIIMYIPIKKKV